MTQENERRKKEDGNTKIF